MDTQRMSKIRVFFRHLTVRLMMVSFIAIVPLNILSMILIQQIVNVYEERLLESYESQMMLYVSSFDAKLQYIENAMNGYLDVEQVYELSNGAAGSDEVAHVRIYNEIKNIRLLADIPSLSYVINNNTGLYSLSIHPYSYSQVFLDGVRDELASQKVGNNKTGEYTVLSTKYGTFLLKGYDFTFFSFGFLIDVDRLLQEVYTSNSNEVDQIYLVSEDGTVVSGVPYNEADLLPKTLQELQEDSSLTIIENRVPLLGYSIVRAIPMDNIAENVPELVTTLRVLAVLSVFALPLIWLLVSYLVLRPLKSMVKALNELERGNFEYRLTGNAGSFQMDYIYHVVNHMAHEIQSLTIESYEKEIAKLQTDSVNLRLQVRPHTLLNSLSTIYNLAQSGENKKVMEFSLNLISYFRYVLRQGEVLVPVREEMKFINDYLALQKVRFPNSFVSECLVEDDALEIRIPPLIIENFVENAVKYALVMGDEIHIGVYVKRQSGSISIEVKDTGCGMEQETVAKLEKGEVVQDELGNHIGVWNCVRRLRLYYGEEAIFRITSELGKGTTVYMELPLEPLDIQVTLRDFTERDAD